jgi:NADPH-dependent curcumin reductase CurA
VEQPRGAFKPENFELRDCAEPGDLKEGEVTVQTLYLSVDPYMRVLMKDDNVAGIFPNFKVGTVPGGAGVGFVIASKNDNFKVGSHLSGFGFSWRKRQNMNPAELGLTKLLDTSVPLHNYISILGMTGHTALLPILKWYPEPKKEHTAYVSAAAGAVGSIAGQIFKSYGMRVVGSAGSAEKLEYLKSIGFDAVFNYKETSVADGLKECAPDGIDVFFDSVGGPTLEAAIDSLNRKGLIIKCGSISDYDNPHSKEHGIRNMGQMLWKCLSMHGYIFSDLMPEFPEALPQLLAMVKDGSLKQREMIVDGFDGLADAFAGLLAGKNIGKVVIKI